MIERALSKNNNSNNESNDKKQKQETEEPWKGPSSVQHNEF